MEPKALEFRFGHESLKLQHQTMKVLVALHEHTGHVVTRDELIERCWDGRIVGDDVINRCISLLRPVAARSGDFQIETVPRSGYRLILTSDDTPHRRLRWRMAAALLLVCAVAGLFTWLYYPFQREDRRTLAVTVVPFSRSSKAGTDHLAADAENALVRMLSDSGIAVRLAAAGGQSAGAESDLLIIGAVSKTAEGEVVTINVEDSRRHAIILSRRVESGAAGVPDLPDRVGATIASALSWSGPLILLDQRKPSDPAFLSHLLTHTSDSAYDPLESFEFARRNAPGAPNSVIAQLALAMDTGFALNEIPKSQRAESVAAARRASERARALAPDFGDVYVPWCLLHSSALVGQCEDQLRLGLSKEVQASFVPQFLGQLLANVGRTEEANAFANVSLAQDRYVSYKLGLRILIAEAVGNSQAAGLYREAVRLWPNDLSFFWLRAEGILERGDFGALDRFEKEAGAGNFPPDYYSAAAIAQALASHSLTRLKSACPTTAEGIQAIQCMIAFSEAGDADQAMGFATTLYPQRVGPHAGSEEAIWLDQPYVQDTAYLTSPPTASLRRHPGFPALAKGLGLLEYWRDGRMPDFCTNRHEEVCGAIANGAR